MMQNFVAVEAALAADPALHVSHPPALGQLRHVARHPRGAEALRRSLPGTARSRSRTGSSLPGTEAEIRKLGDALGLEYDPDTGMWVHNLRTAVIGPDGKLVRVIHGNDWKPDELVADLRAAADRR